MPQADLPNPLAKLKTEDFGGNLIQEFKVRPVAKYLAERLGISYRAAYARVRRGVVNKMREHDEVIRGKVHLREWRKIGGTILIKREAVMRVFVNGE